MKKAHQKNTWSFSKTASAIALAAVLASPSIATAAPSLIITNDPLPPEVKSKVYAAPPIAAPIDPSSFTGPNYYDSTTTAVTGEIGKLQSGLARMQQRMGELSGRALSIKQQNQSLAATYYANVASINTQLQSGTTPANPRLVQRLNEAQGALDRLASNAAGLNQLSVELGGLASESNFLLESARSAFRLPGAVEEDHLFLAQMEDQVNATIVLLDRLQNTVADDIARTNAYLAAEQSNSRTLALAVQTGDFMSANLSNRSFSQTNMAPAPAVVPSYTPASATASMPVAAAPSAVYEPVALPPSTSSLPAISRAVPESRTQQRASMGNDNDYRDRTAGVYAHQPAGAMASRTNATSLQPVVPAQPAAAANLATPGRQLATINFDRADINFAQPVYDAANSVLKQNPNARFEVMAVTPTSGNAAKQAIEASKAKRNAERVLRSLTEMGIPADRVALTNSTSTNADSNQVHIFVR